MKIRLNKYLAQLGVASRRKVDELIERNQVWVNDKRVDVGYKVDPATDVIRVGKRQVSPGKRAPLLEYWLVNKPVGYVSTTSDPDGRRTVVSMVKSKQRLFPVGRLDADSEGLMLLTNDGELTQLLTHPKHHIPKRYLVWVHGQITPRGLDRIRSGIRLKRERAAPAEIEVLEHSDSHAVLEITLYQGLHRQVRRMMAALNLKVERLQRVAIGAVKLGNLSLGSHRVVTAQELELLKKV